MPFFGAVLACDDRGTTNPYSGSNTYAIGGFASHISQHPRLIRAWRAVKEELCGSSEVELKWSHFFPGAHQVNSHNPLLSENSDAWRSQAIWALGRIFSQTAAFPITTVVRKDSLNEGMLGKTPKGKTVIDIGLVFAAVQGQFALYLKQHRLPKGQIWFDQLGSMAEQERFQEGLLNFYDSLDTAAMPKARVRLVRKIDPHVQFKDSNESEVIQIADFVSGVIWAAAEGDTVFLEMLLEAYAPGGKRTYGIVIVEK
jgi:hypothetical protein